MEKAYMKFISTVLAAVMLITLLPMQVLAVDAKTTTGTYEYLKYSLTDGDVTITGFDGSTSNVVIPDEIKGNPVIAIGSNAFNDFAIVENVKFGSNLKTIGDWAFYNTTIETLELPESIESLGDSAFGDTPVESVYIPKNLETCGYAPFNSCANLKQVSFETGMTKIPDHLFENTGLTTIEIPKTVTVIGNSAFSECSLLKSVTLNEGLKTIEDWTFYKAPIEELELPSTLTKLGNSAFSDNIALKTIYIPKNLETCEYAPFSGCKNLKNVSFEEGITTIPANLFSNSGLRSIEIPQTVTVIGDSAFSECSLLKSVTFNDGLKAIEGWAFYKTPIEEIKLPNTLTKLGNSSFADNTVLKTVYVPKSLKTCDYAPFDGTVNLRTVDYQDGIKVIPANVFSYSGLRKVVIPDSVTNIGDYAFSNCESLLTVTLSNNLETIGAGAFSNCISLESIYIPKSLENSGGDIFSGCNKLKSVEFEEGISTIVTGILSGTAIESIVIPSTVKTIEVDAFANCDQLQYIYIPSSVTEFGWDILWGSDNTTIVTTPNSQALIYAIENNKPFSLSGEFEDKDSYVLNRQNTRYASDINNISINGFFNLYVNYAIKDKWANKTTEEKIIVKLPSITNVEEDSDYEIIVKLDGQKVTNYEYDSFNKTISIPVEEPQGSVTVTLKADSQGALTSIAFLDAKKNGEEIREVIGSVNECANILTIEAPDTVSENTFTVSGLAPASQKITVKLNGNIINTVTASKAGKWTADIKLNQPDNFKSYVISSSYYEGNEEIVKEKKVVYKSDGPQLTEFILSYNEHEIKHSVDLLDPDYQNEYIVFQPDMRVDFTVKFSDSSEIEKVYITSLRNGQKKYLEAKYDENKKAYITDGFFDEDDHNYVPGLISCECSLKEPEIIYGDNDQIYNILNKYSGEYQNATTTTVDTDIKKQSSLDLGKLTDSLKGYEIVYNAEVYEGKKTDAEAWLGIDLDTCAKGNMKDAQGQEVEVMLDYSDPYKQIIAVHEKANNKYIKYTSAITGDASEKKSLCDVANVLKERVSGIDEACDKLFNYYGLSQDYTAYNKYLMTNLGNVDPDSPLYETYSITKEKAEIIMRGAAEAIFIQYLGWTGMNLAKDSLFGKTVYGISSLIGLYAAGREYIKNFAKEMANQGKDWFENFLHNLFSKKVQWAPDPSGYVYDIDSGERIKDVVVTAYYIPNDDSETFWDNKPQEDEYGDLWDAAEYDQNNPLITNIDGLYAWNVPEGWWRVKYEKEGYETTWSDWMTVPPIQTEVNIGMKSTGEGGFLLGDVNGDKSVNAKDLTALARHLAKIEVITESVRLKAADTNQDSTVTAEDLTHLARYVARIIARL